MLKTWLSSAAIGLTLTVTVVSAQSTHVAQSTWLTAAELKTTFSGKTVNGEYPGGRKFIERYGPDGTIQYEEPNITARGKWSISGQSFCTFYDNPGMGGACFLVARSPTNCIQYHIITNQPSAGTKPLASKTWDARGVLSGEKGNCTDAQSV
jgi:hypothetical protein